VKLNQTVNIRMGAAAAMLAVALIAGSLFGSLVTAQNRRVPFDLGRVAPVYIAGNDGHASDQVSFLSGFTAVLKTATPAVVNISSSKLVRNPEYGFMPLFNDPFFRQFFGDEFGRQFNIPRER
jgi:hypothetical protein